MAPLDDYVLLDPEANNRTMDSISFRNTASGVFAGLWFTLVAVAGTEDESTATKLVRCVRCGVQICNAVHEGSKRNLGMTNREADACIGASGRGTLVPVRGKVLLKRSFVGGAMVEGPTGPTGALGAAAYVGTCVRGHGGYGQLGG